MCCLLTPFIRIIADIKLRTIRLLFMVSFFLSLTPGGDFPLVVVVNHLTSCMYLCVPVSDHDALTLEKAPALLSTLIRLTFLTPPIKPKLVKYRPCSHCAEIESMVSVPVVSGHRIITKKAISKSHHYLETV